MATHENYLVDVRAEEHVREVWKEKSGLFGLITWNTLVKSDSIGKAVSIHIPMLRGTDSVLINGDKVWSLSN